jgi:hypothetical protein
MLSVPLSRIDDLQINLFAATKPFDQFVCLGDHPAHAFAYWRDHQDSCFLATLAVVLTICLVEGGHEVKVGSSARTFWGVLATRIVFNLSILA